MAVTNAKVNTQQADRPFFRLSDLVVVALILAIACSLFLAKLAKNRARSDQGLWAEIYQANQLVARVPLDGLISGTYHLGDLAQEGPLQAPSRIDQTPYGLDHYLFSADGQGGLKISQAPCPDRLCQRGGYLHKVGDLSICVPGQVLVKIVAPSSPDPKSPAQGEGLDMVIGQGQNAEEATSP